MDATASTEMPRYKCHKIVHALKIIEVVLDSDVARSENRETTGGAMLTPEEEGFAPFEVSHDYVRKHDPQPGGYYVVYEGGYKSFSPADAFKGGYTLIEDSRGVGVSLVLSDDQIASICHDANRRYCMINDDSKVEAAATQPIWGAAPQWQKDSVRRGVENIRAGLVSSPEESHERWLAYKESEGWTYGERKDSERKTHPCMVPWTSLPADQRQKDRLFFAIVSSFKEG